MKSGRSSRAADRRHERRRDPLAREVDLGSLLGQVIVEQAGPDLLDLVERVRHGMIALGHGDDPAERDRLGAELDGLDLESTEALIRSFSLYFQLANLAEERQRVRTLRRRARRAPQGLLEDLAGQAVRTLWRRDRDLRCDRRTPRADRVSRRS